MNNTHKNEYQQALPVYDAKSHSTCKARYCNNDNANWIDLHSNKFICAACARHLNHSEFHRNDAMRLRRHPISAIPANTHGGYALYVGPERRYPYTNNAALTSAPTAQEALIVLERMGCPDFIYLIGNDNIDLVFRWLECKLSTTPDWINDRIFQIEALIKVGHMYYLVSNYGTDQFHGAPTHCTFDRFMRRCEEIM